MNEIEKLQERITFLEKHIGEQDTEIFQQSRRVDLLIQEIKKLEARFEASEQGGGAGTMPADEPPPHY